MMIDAARSANGLKDGNAGWDKRRGDQELTKLGAQCGNGMWWGEIKYGVQNMEANMAGNLVQRGSFWEGVFGHICLHTSNAIFGSFWWSFCINMEANMEREYGEKALEIMGLTFTFR